MLKNRDVIMVLNLLSKKKYKKSFRSINEKQRAVVRRIVVKAFTKKS